MALPAAEIINETMWVVYFLIAKKSSNFVLKGTNIDENFMINIFENVESRSSCGAYKYNLLLRLHNHIRNCNVEYI